MNERYIVVEESLSNHCCFEATIVDTSEGRSPNDPNWKGETYWNKTICECFTKEDAYFIAKQLNDKLEVDTLLFKKYDS